MNEGAVYLAGFGGRGGFGRRPALIVVDMTLGFTDPESPLGSNLNNLIDAIRKLHGAARPGEIPVITTVAYRESDKLTGAAFIDKVPALLALGTGSRWAEIDPSIAPRKAEPVSNKLFASGLFETGSAFPAPLPPLVWTPSSSPPPTPRAASGRRQWTL